MKTLAFAALATLAIMAPAVAQDHAGHGAMGAGSASTEAYKAAMMTMHENMEMEYTGDADTDFLEGMIPHHQGAVDMAKVVLEYGEDPEIRALAEQIIADQEEEIATMQQLLAEREGAN
jgi:uncharacterized protein (DUF305 family)